MRQTLEAYLYAMDDPVNGHDPNGMVGIPGQEWKSPDMKCSVGCRGWNPFSFVIRLGHKVWAAHARILQVTLFVGEFAGAIACTLATDGLCGVTLAEIPVGEFAFGAISGALLGAANDSLRNGRDSTGGYAMAALNGAELWTSIGAGFSFTGVIWPAGAHAVPRTLVGVLRDLLGAIR